MKPVAVAVVLGLISLVHVARAEIQMKEPALLMLPNSISMSGSLPAIVEVHWDKATPVTISTWLIRGRLSTWGYLMVFDENGKDVPALYPTSLPTVPSGAKEVRRGEGLRIDLYSDAAVTFQHPGRYYAVADFNFASSGGANVMFTTQKCWFQVTAAKSPKT